MAHTPMARTPMARDSVGETKIQRSSLELQINGSVSKPCTPGEHVEYPLNGICLMYGYGSKPINTIFGGMNIHLPAILMFTRGTRF